MIFNSLRINNYRAYYGECNFDFPLMVNGTSASFTPTMT